MRSLLEKLSFAAGAAGKGLHARLDLARAQIAVAACENFVVMVEGGLTRRPGTRFVLEHKDETQKAELLPFRFSGGEGGSYMIAINGGVARYLSQGGFVQSLGVPYELAVPFAEAYLPNVRWTQDGNIMTLSCAGLQQRQITRLGHTDWTIAPYAAQNGPFETQNVVESKTLQVTAVTGTALVMTAVGHTPFVASDVGTQWRLDEIDLASVPPWIANEAIAVGAQRRFDGNVYEVTAGSNTGITAPIHTDGDAKSGGGATDVTWRYRHSGFGHVVVTEFTNSASVKVDVTLRLPNSVVSAPTYRWWAPSWSATRGWPELVYRYQQRMLFMRGPWFWFSTVANPNDHQQGAEDDAAISGVLRSQDGSLVDFQWVVASGVLLGGTRDGEWALRSTNVVDAVTVTNIRPIPESNEGSAPHVPAAVDGGALMIGRSRKRLHFVKFDRTSEGIDVVEATVSNREILNGRATHLAFQRDPNRICWIGCMDGSLVALTWMPEQQLVGWSTHPLRNGYVEAVRAVPSSDEGVSEVYLSVRRVINGQTRRYFEQLTDFFAPLDPKAPTAEGAWFLDCAIRYQGAATTTIGGLGHLEGQSVSVFSVGRWIARDLVVSDGAVTVPQQVTDAIVGLPIDYRIKSLPSEWPQSQGGSSSAKQKTASKVLVRVMESGGGRISVNGGAPEALFRTGAQLNDPVKLYTGKLWPTTEAKHDRDLVWEITGSDPLPFTLLGAGPDAEAEEGGG